MARPEDRTREQQLARSTPFRRNEDKEALLRMRDERPDAFDRLTPAQRIGAGLYESDRERHEALGGDAA